MCGNHNLVLDWLQEEKKKKKKKPSIHSELKCFKIKGGSCYDYNKMGKSNNPVAKGHKCFANREYRGGKGGNFKKSGKKSLILGSSPKRSPRVSWQLMEDHQFCTRFQF